MDTLASILMFFSFSTEKSFNGRHYITDSHMLSWNLTASIPTKLLCSIPAEEGTMSRESFLACYSHWVLPEVLGCWSDKSVYHRRKSKCLRRKQKKRNGFKKVHIVVPAGSLPSEYSDRCNVVARRLDCTLTRLPASPIKWSNSLREISLARRKQQK